MNNNPETKKLKRVVFILIALAVIFAVCVSSCIRCLTTPIPYDFLHPLDEVLKVEIIYIEKEDAKGLSLPENYTIIKELSQEEQNDFLEKVLDLACYRKGPPPHTSLIGYTIQIYYANGDMEFLCYSAVAYYTNGAIDFIRKYFLKDEFESLIYEYVNIDQVYD